MTKTVKCERCGVPVEVDKIDRPDRCTDPDCPLNEITRQRNARPQKPSLGDILNGG